MSDNCEDKLQQSIEEASVARARLLDDIRNVRQSLGQIKETVERPLINAQQTLAGLSNSVQSSTRKYFPAILVGGAIATGFVVAEILKPKRRKQISTAGKKISWRAWDYLKTIGGNTLLTTALPHVETYVRQNIQEFLSNALNKTPTSNAALPATKSAEPTSQMQSSL